MANELSKETGETYPDDITYEEILKLWVEHYKKVRRGPWSLVTFLTLITLVASSLFYYMYRRYKRTVPDAIDS